MERPGKEDGDERRRNRWRRPSGGGAKLKYAKLRISERLLYLKRGKRVRAALTEGRYEKPQPGALHTGLGEGAVMWWRMRVPPDQLRTCVYT